MSETPKTEPTHDEKLAALQARKDAADKRRKAQAEQIELADAEAEALATEALADIEAKHGADAKTRVTMLQVKNRFVILERGLEVIYTKFQADLLKANKARKDVDESVFMNYLRPLVVYPDRQAFEKLFSDFPMCLARLVDEANKLYGLKSEEDQKK